MNTCYIQSFKILASFCSWAGWFESYWSKIPEDTFLRDVAHIVMCPKDADGMANSVDPDQTGPLWAVWSGSTLFAQTNLSKNLGSVWYHSLFAHTGDSRYVDFAYLDTITYVEVIFHSQHFFSMYLAFQLRLCRKRLTWSNGYLEVIFHVLDVISIIFATSYVEVKNRRSHGRHIVCFGCVHVWPEVQKSSNKNQNQLKWYIPSFDWAINPLHSAIKSMAVLIRNHTQYR